MPPAAEHPEKSIVAGGRCDTFTPSVVGAKYRYYDDLVLEVSYSGESNTTSESKASADSSGDTRFARVATRETRHDGKYRDGKNRDGSTRRIL